MDSIEQIVSYMNEVNKLILLDDIISCLDQQRTAEQVQESSADSPG